jgi:hypothetical protein
MELAGFFQIVSVINSLVLTSHLILIGFPLLQFIAERDTDTSLALSLLRVAGSSLEPGPKEFGSYLIGPFLMIRVGLFNGQI